MIPRCLLMFIPMFALTGCFEKEEAESTTDSVEAAVDSSDCEELGATIRADEEACEDGDEDACGELRDAYEAYDEACGDDDEREEDWDDDDREDRCEEWEERLEEQAEA